MVRFTATIKQFGRQGEKTGWSYIDIPADMADKLAPGNKKGFHVKGKLDNFPIKRVALIPMGGGNFILTINAALRKGTGKRKGAMLKVQLQLDDSPFVFNADFIACLDDDPKAKEFFNTLSRSHQHYFSKWIDTAKTEQTLTKRIAMAVNALSRHMGFPEMLRNSRNNV